MCGDQIPKASPSGIGGRIAFASNRDGDFEIFVMDADGAHVRQLTHNTVKDYQPDWSPDGSQMVFVRQRDPNSTSSPKLRLLDPATGKESDLTVRRSGGEEYPAWSPDGNWIAFASGDGDGSGIVLARVDGTKRRLVAAPEESSLNFDPSWSPDSTGVVYIEVYVDSKLSFWGSSHGFRDAGLNRSINNPVWSPDGEKILFSLGAYREYDNDVSDTDSDLYTISRGRTVTALEENEPCATQPGSWSPDGQHIVFYSDRAGSFDIYTMTSKGDSVRRLTTSKATDINPDWGP